MTAHRPLAPAAPSRRRAPLRPRVGLLVADATSARRAEIPRNYGITPSNAGGPGPAARAVLPRQRGRPCPGSAGDPAPAARRSGAAARAALPRQRGGLPRQHGCLARQRGRPCPGNTAVWPGRADVSRRGVSGQQKPRPSGAAALAAVPVVPVLAVQAGGVVGHVGLHLARRAYIALG